MIHQENYDKMEGLRRSDLWEIHKSPLHFRQMMDTPRRETPSLAFGIAVHKYILEPVTFYDEFQSTPKVDRRTKDGKQVWAAFMDLCEKENKSPIDDADLATIKEMSDAVWNHPLAKQLLQNATVESEWQWTDPVTGEKLKCKCDIITTYNGKKYVVDYKTTDSCENGHFERSARKYGYQFQAGFYTTGVSMNTGEDYGFAFIAQEKKAPYAVRVYICSDMFVENGKAIYRNLLDIYHDCKLTDNWYGYEGNSNIQPTLLMDDSERYDKGIYTHQPSNQAAPLYESTFHSDAYLDDTEESSDYTEDI